MPVSTLAYVKEMARQAITGDENFFRRMLYYFELRIPADVGILGDTDFLYPLIIPPESYTLEEPFAVEATPTQGGGLYVEENGIVQRMIRLRGTTGFKPRTLKTPGSLGAIPATISPEKKSFSRKLPFFVFDKISGARHFQYLQDSVFRTYADLKRDPAMSKGTMLIFHNPKDDEHWIVAPQRFSLERNAAQPFTYWYTIELLVVDKAEDAKADFSEDKSLFDRLKDNLRAIKGYADMATGAINDLTALVGEIKSFVKDAVKILDAVTSIVEAVNNFVDGVTDLIKVPYAFVESTIELIEAAMDVANTVMEGVNEARNFPETVKNKFMTAWDSLEGLGSYPALFETPTEATIRKIRDQQSVSRSITTERKQTALKYGHPTSFDQVRNLGTQLTAGDVQSASGEITIGSQVKKYKSARQITVEQGDSLVSLAARYMGDARLWQQIAVYNGIKPPFVDNQASVPLAGESGSDDPPFDGAVGVGSQIMIPTNQKSPLEMPVLPVIGAKLTEPAEVQFLGADFQLAAVQDLAGSSRAMYDIPINSDLGSVDAKLVKGKDNLGQMLILRLLTEKGTDTLYKQVGLRKILGLGMAPVDMEMARFRVLESIKSDPRVSGVRDLKIAATGEGDVFEIDVTVEIRGLSETRAVRVAI